MIFVDTSAWFSAFVRNDPDYPVASTWLDSVGERLVTTDYVVDELLTLLKVRGEVEIALQLGGQLFEEGPAQIEWVHPQDVYRAWISFSSRREMGWSFTDCVSQVVISRLGIKTAFAFDEHFQQFGSLKIVPL